YSFIMKGFISAVTVLSLAMFLMPAVSLADWSRGSERDVRVRNYNYARISNHVDSSANTGGNWAGGSEGGDGGNGGDAEAGKWGDVEDTGTGNGGNGGASDAGGAVTTGNASTDTDVWNVANSNDTRVTDDCGCDDDDSDWPWWN